MVKHTKRLLAMVTACAMSLSSLAWGQDLPIRPSPRPATTDSVPHVQIGVTTKPEINAELLRRVGAMPGVDLRRTVISLPGAVGFWLADGVPVARPDMIVGGREFAHMHPDGSLHASLSPDIATKAIAAGWATSHPWSKTRPGWEGFVMIYTPSSMDELETVLRLIQSSYSFVTES